MPDFFEFRADDDYVRGRLTPGEIAGVQTWQNARLHYQFSFHTQHEAGWPCYLSEPDGPGRNLPKINTRQPTNQLLQGESIRNRENGNDFVDVILANMALFQKLARLYYEGQDEQRPTAGPVWVVSFKCNMNRQGRPILVKLPQAGQALGSAYWSNMSRFAKAPTCPQHRNSNCMVGEAKQIPANEAAQVTKVFDQNGEIQG